MNREQQEQNSLSLTPADRVFQIDRDTFLIYTGIHRNDLLPFVRSGCGVSIPLGLSRHIGNVIFSEDANINVGQELKWLDAGIQEQQQNLCYVGTKTQVSQFYKYANSKYAQSSAKKESLPPVKLLPFSPIEMNETGNKVTTHLLRKGNFEVRIGNKKIFDSLEMSKRGFSLEREYEMIHSSLSQSERQLEDPNRRSFLWFGPEYPSDEGQPMIHWNLTGSGVLMNPSSDHHYAFLEERIDPEGAAVFLSHSPHSSGLMEAIRHKHMKQQKVAVFTGFENFSSICRRLYPNADLSSLSDGAAVPLVSGTGFFHSKTRSHGVFSWKLKKSTSQITQILFPLGGSRPRKTFSRLRAPHDVEIQLIKTRKEINESNSHLALQIPHGISESIFGLFRLARNRYPLVPHREYVFHQGLTPQELVSSMMNCFQYEGIGLPYEKILRDFCYLNLGLNLTQKSLTQAFRNLQAIKIPMNNTAERHNMGAYLEFMKTLPAYQNVYTSLHKMKMKILSLKFHPYLFSYRSWLGLQDENVEFHILIVGGKQTFLFAKPIPPVPVSLKMPFLPEELQNDPRLYPRLLKTWSRNINKLGLDSRGWQDQHELMEKFYQERLRLLEERKRLTSLISLLNLDLSAQPTTKRQESLLDQLRHHVVSIWNGEKGRFDILDSVGPVFRLIPIAFLGLVLLFGAFKGISYIGSKLMEPASQSYAEAGTSSAKEAASLVQPGKLQSSKKIPGEENISVVAAEVLQYANSLAKSNGFKTISAAQSGINLKDPNIVFPGDALKLPDGRLAKIKKGGHIWEISQLHYRKDFARMYILRRQIDSKLKKLKNKKTSTNIKIRDEILKKEGLMKRLAVTPKMKDFLEETSSLIKISLS